MSHRSGTVLIVVAGIAALLAALALTFIQRMRSDVEETDVIVGESQARIMLLAACDYVLEGARLGYDAAPQSPPVAPPGGKHKEAYGWIDVRDGSTGPKGDDAGWPELFSTAAVEDDGHGGRRPAWPAKHSVARCPMYVMNRPPYATRQTACYNPIDADPASPDFGYPYLRNPDPQPQVTNNWTFASPTSTSDNVPVPTEANQRNWALYIGGDPRPRQSSYGMSWFRVYRDDDATFVVTCGAGGTEGFRDWAEVVAAGDQDEFGSQAQFEELLGRELRLWYRIQWSAAILAPEYSNICGNLRTPNGSDGRWDSLIDPNARDHLMLSPPNSSSTWCLMYCRTQLWNKNLVGTIPWVQRLTTAPSIW